jgi:O-methyltransferase involved in polyketide biosynthesis
MTEKVAVSNLSGVPETMLWPLYGRAGEARRPDARLIDPLAVKIADAINYDYARNFGKPTSRHVFRALAIDRLLRAWLRQHPGGQVVGLGEGLETQFHRVDDGRVRWLSVDVPESIDVRNRFIPDGERKRNLACSALDLRWFDEVDASGGLFVTAAGLLMYLPPDQVPRLVAAIAERFPTAEIAFDTVPHWASRRTLKGVKLTPEYTVPPMPWAIDRDELESMKRWHANIADVTAQPYVPGRGFFFGVVVPVLHVLPFLRNKLPLVVHLRCALATR